MDTHTKADGKVARAPSYLAKYPLADDALHILDDYQEAPSTKSWS